MSSGFDKSLLIFSGKGGAGKSTVAAAAAVAAARRGKRVLIVEIGDEERMPAIFGLARRSGYAGSEVQAAGAGSASIWSMCLTARESLHEFAVRSMKFEVLQKAVFENRAMRFFTAAAPGLDELTIMGKLEFFCRTNVAPAAGARFDLAILDAPATGQALAFFKVPQMAMRMSKGGPLHSKAERMWNFVSDPVRSAFHIVTLAEDMSVNESIELHRAAAGMGLPAGAVVVNAVFPDLLEGVVLPAAPAAANIPGDLAGRVTRAAFDAAAWSSARVEAEREALAKLAAGLSARRIVLPFIFPPRIGRPELGTLADGLEGL